MKATHTNYLHPRHLRVVKNDGSVVCASPSVSYYSKLNRPGLPCWLKDNE